ncbi:ras-like GTP-binding protein rhoA isoform X1 [Ixodes scapularis]|uniref:ras-like GTP-binding protein rhoA isoform X1 n=1 Tax=Ixodes scapularis TaxID=6945 RepID=UPI001A9E7F2B|nr:ras-like GTP-binding protein rhoA isoform X1 [Ixodes scapularis]
MSVRKDLPELRLVVVGDSQCGKTGLLSTFVYDLFPTTHVATTLDNHATLIKWRRQMVRLSLWDTAGSSEYDSLRPLAYPQASAVLVCFALDDRDSLINVEQKWVPEVRRRLPRVPIVLVGNKRDLREHRAPSYQLNPCRGPLITTLQGKMIAEHIRASAYVECSAIMQQGLDQVLEAAVTAAIGTTEQAPKKSSSSKCSCSSILEILKFKRK